MAESEEELKSLLMSVKEEWKSWLETEHEKNCNNGIQSHHFMADRWRKNGQWQILFSRDPKSLWMVELKYVCSLEGKLWQT